MLHHAYSLTLLWLVAIAIAPNAIAQSALPTGTLPTGTSTDDADDVTYAFLVTGDPQYLAEHSATPTKLDFYSEQANSRFLEIVRSFPKRPIPPELGGGDVASELLGMLVVGDLIDSADKNGGPYPAMQRFEWQRYLRDYGLTGKDGGLTYPIYELHGNHDGPQGDTFVVDEIIARNQRRPGVKHVSENGLHYSWDWGPLHLVSLGIFVGEGELRRKDFHYSPRASLEFLRADLAEHVGDSGRPVVLAFHIHPNCPEFDWPPQDLAAFWDLVQSYNIVAMFHGHTHGSPPHRMQWNGQDFAPELPGGIDVFNPDDSAAAKTDPKNPAQGVGLLHGFLYVELIDRPGSDNDTFVVRSLATRNNWATHDWDRIWSKKVSLRSPSAQESASPGPILDKQQQLDRQTFWDNQDWDWYAEQIPFFECPDADITTTYYYRWELLTKHLTYGSPTSGYSFTEFIDRPFWSGAYGAISCPAGHQLYEARWLRKPRIARDYLRYWFRTPGAQPRNYSTWLADSAWALHKVHPDEAFLVDLLPDLIRNYEGWEERQFVPEVGLFWQTGHDDGMEFNINSRQTNDILRGAPSYRPSFNAYMWADAMAIAKIARLAEQPETAQRFEQKAASIKAQVKARLWDERRQFFFPAFRDDEERDGHKIKALSRTYETGQFAGDTHGRELIGYVPWQFNMLESDQRYEAAWAKLMDRDGFYADFGPTTVERNDPMFLLKDSCCWWSGQSWPFATTQTLKAMANLLQQHSADTRTAAATLPITPADYQEMLKIYSRSHRKDGRPYLAEALHPDTGSFKGHDAYNHSEHYLHSGYCDLVITGLVGLIEQADDRLVVDPLAPAEWDYFALDDVPYHGHRLSILWDRTGERYGRGAGLHVLSSGQILASSATLGRLEVEVPPLEAATEQDPTEQDPTEQDETALRVNYAVNNDGHYYPRLQASFVAPGTAVSKIHDGNYWYHIDPPNRWSTNGSPDRSDWVVVDFGVPRRVDTLKLYFLDDAADIDPPESFLLESWDGAQWQAISETRRHPPQPTGRRANTVTFAQRAISKLRVTLNHAAGARSGLTELEAWGGSSEPYQPAPPPAGNLAYNSSGEGFPKATASHSDRFGGQPMRAIDGKIVFIPTPMNRWTSYESPTASDWLEIDFGKPREVGRVELHVYDDRGGVQPPAKMTIEYHDGTVWREVSAAKSSPEKPVGSVMNTIRFTPVQTTKLRAVFTHQGNARSGVTEMEVWRE